jgi:hypothetical protein
VQVCGFGPKAQAAASLAGFTTIKDVQVSELWLFSSTLITHPFMNVTLITHPFMNVTLITHPLMNVENEFWLLLLFF